MIIENGDKKSSDPVSLLYIILGDRFDRIPPNILHEQIKMVTLSKLGSQKFSHFYPFLRVTNVQNRGKVHAIAIFVIETQLMHI